MASAVPQRDGVVGIDIDRVTVWFTANVAPATPPLNFELIAGGRSNLTYRVVDAHGRRFALRRPPVSHVLPTAHDMTREHRLISALAPTPVPVPLPYGLCTDEEVNGAPFYVMEFVDGHIVRDATEAEAAFDPATRGAVGGHLADTLATLHAVDVDAVGLGDLARHDGYVERQLRRWGEQYRQMQVPGVDHGPIVEEVGAALAAAVPDQQAMAVVHGDYRLDNVVLDDVGAVRAILDWEICTLGDPLADVGLLLVYWSEPGDEQAALLGSAPTTAPGFSSRQEVLDAYARRSSLEVSGIGYYVAFGYWKLACILQGVYARYLAGAGAGDTSSVGDYPTHIRRLAELAGERLSAA
ncbi:MAG TPA: phosphotransferase family protein [Acidimicrobiales bacterium]|nr:phosphotransferase family protein [Acidimicrobiales bacterium]